MTTPREKALVALEDASNWATEDVDVCKSYIADAVKLLQSQPPESAATEGVAELQRWDLSADWDTDRTGKTSAWVRERQSQSGKWVLFEDAHRISESRPVVPMEGIALTLVNVKRQQYGFPPMTMDELMEFPEDFPPFIQASAVHALQLTHSAPSSSDIDEAVKDLNAMAIAAKNAEWTAFDQAYERLNAILAKLGAR